MFTLCQVKDLQTLLSAIGCEGFTAIYTGLQDETSPNRAKKNNQRYLRPDICLVPTGCCDPLAPGDLPIGSANCPEGRDDSKLNEDANTHKHLSTGTLYTWTEVVIQVEHRTSEDHLSGPRFEPGDVPPADSSGLDEQSRDKIEGHATEIFRHQHRCFVFVISIYGDQARFLRFDRSGVIVSDAFDYRTSTHIMGEFIYRLFKTGTAADRGHDPTAVLASEADTEFFR